MAGKIKLNEKQLNIAEKYRPTNTENAVDTNKWVNTSATVGVRKDLVQKYNPGIVSSPPVKLINKPETPRVSPVSGNNMDYDKLMQQRQQAQIDLDVDTVNRIDAQLKAMRAAEGKQTFADRAGDTTGAAAAGYVGNVANALGTAAESLGAKSFAQKAKNLADIAGEDAGRFTQDAKTGLGAGGQFLVDAGIAGQQMAIDMAAGALIPFGGQVAMGTRVFGGGAKEARDAGATQGQQMAYGALTAATALLTEKISNVSGLFKGTYGKGLLDNALEKITSKPAGKLILSALSEGGEEMLEGALQPLLQRMTYDPDAGYDSEWLAETLYSGAVGAILGGFGGGVDVVTGRGKATFAKKETDTAKAANPSPGADRNTVPISESNLQQPAQDVNDPYDIMPKLTKNDAEEQGPANTRLQESDLDTYLQVGDRQHVRNQKGKILTNGGSPILTKATEIVDFIRKSFAGEIKDEIRAYGRVGKQFADRVRKATGGNVAIDNYYLELNSNQIAHLSDHVGTDKDPRSVPLTKEQVEQIPEYIDSFDDLIDVIKRKDGSLRLMLGKKINGHSIIIEAVSRGRQSLHPVTAYQVDSEHYLQNYKTKAVDRSSTSQSENSDHVDISRPTTTFDTNVSQRQKAVKDPYDIMPKLTAETIPVKAQKVLVGTENALLQRIGRALSVPAGVQRSDLKELVRSISNEYLRDGKVSQDSLDSLFEAAYERGIETDTEYYDQHKGVKEILRTTAVSISKEDQSGIADYNDFRKAAMGTLRISNAGTPVDVLYEQLNEMDPALFPESITHPADQLLHMYEVGKSIRKVEKTLNEYYGEDAGTFKAWAKRDFQDAVNGAMAELNTVRRFAEEAARKQAAKMANTPEQVRAAYEGIRAARKKRDRAVSKNLLTDSDDAQVSRLLKGEIKISDLNPREYNVRGIREVYEAKLEYEQLARVIREYKKQHSQKLRDEAEVLLKGSVNWRDKKAGMLYSRETMERNIRDIVPDKEVADRIIRKYFTPVHAKQAEATRAKNDYRNRVRKMGLSRKVAAGNEVSEAHAVQLLGEAEDNIRMLENSTEKNAKRDGQTLQEWRLVVEKLKSNNPNMDWAKVNRAVNEFRVIYDELFQKMNEVRLRNGYEPVAYRQGYFPHFQPGETGLLASFGAALGITTDVTELPTTINGLTHTFKPGITYFGHAQERKGFNTAYDAVQGFDKYIEGAADVIYHTDNIQRLRALANQIRYRAGDEGLRKQADEVMANENLTEELKQAAINDIYKEGGFALSNFVVELEEYTNLLANKKSRADRNMEQAIGRRGYNLMKALESRVAANMVAINPGSWLTNFIPITQGMASLNSKALLKGMWDTLKAYKVDDGMVDMSTFLSNRRGSDPIVKTLAQQASATLSKPMEYIDRFTADTLVRARYNQNVADGMSAAEALNEADTWAAKVMADRSKGSMPTVFNRTNPLTKLFTQFQLEVNNQMSYVFKDVPDEIKEKGLNALAAGLLKMFVGAWLYNEVYEYFIGRRPAMDPLGIINEAAGDLTGYELPNLIDMGMTLAGGEKPDFTTEKTGADEAVKTIGTNVAENLPFFGGLIGGGRLPISSALPDMENLGKALLSEDWDPKKKRATIAKEAISPAAYLGLPFGGGQIKKAAQGIGAVARGGSYTVNNKGEDILQYPILSETASGKAMDYLQAGIFGKSSMPEAQDWVKQGFNSLNAKETAAYQNLTAAGESGRTAFDLLQLMGSVQKTEEESTAYLKRKALRRSDLSEEGKGILFYDLLAGDKEKELLDGADETERGNTAAMLMDIKDAQMQTGDEEKKAKYKAIEQADVSDEIKAKAYSAYVTDSKDNEIQNMLNHGVNFNDWMDFESRTGGMKTDDASTRKKKVLDALDGMRASDDQKAAIFFASAATDADVEKQQELEASNGITKTQYWKYLDATAGLSKKAEKLVAINRLPLTSEQKTALYFANDWAESTLDEAPWYRESWDIMPRLTANPFQTTAQNNLSKNPFQKNQNPFQDLVMPKL